MADDAPSPRDTFITVYGRRPVLEVLGDPALSVDKVVLAHGAREQSAIEILRLAEARGVPVTRMPADRVTRISRNGRQDQGVVADVVAPAMRPLVEHLDAITDPRRGTPPPATQHVLVLDGVTNPANVGMVLRSATAAGLDGVVLPHRGVPEVGPLVIKASAGVAFRASILRSPTAEDALERLQAAGFVLLGLDSEAPVAHFAADIAPWTAFVLGSESLGVTPEARAWIHDWVSLPLAGGVESLNVACAATALAYELVRRRAGD